MPTLPNMTAIQTVTVGAGGTSTIAFTSIPQTYSDLLIVYSAKSSFSGAQWGQVYVQFNGSNASMSNRYLSGNGSSPATGSDVNITGGFATTGGTGGTNAFSNCSIYIPNYTTSNNKSFSVDYAPEMNATSSLIGFAANLWSNTAAITSISLIDYNASFVQYSTATLYGITNFASNQTGAYATGGTITTDGQYWYHAFTSSGTFTPTKNLSVDYLVVAGGGGGGEEIAGGGGAGGLRCTVGATGGGGTLELPLSVTASTAYTVTIGAGGSGGVNSSNTSATNGNNSVFGSITSTGGGRGGSYIGSAQSGAVGGSGGGGNAASDFGSGGAGTANQGYAGATAIDSGSRAGGGGGGAGAAAVTPAGGSGLGSPGGVGVATAISGTSTFYAGGGGGGFQGSVVQTGGTGGGGNGGVTAPSPTVGSAGTANTGGGGGGGGNNRDGGNGGSGIVIVRYSVNS